jgi:hypothetical protein
MGVGKRARTLLVGLFRSKLRRAERAEALGRLDHATLLYIEAEEPAEAARVLALRADAAVDPAERLRLLGQAIGHAGEPQARALRLRRARLRVDLARRADLVFGASELGELGSELEALEEPALAAEVYALAGDSDAEARALVAAGAVERLEEMLESEQERARGERARVKLWQRVRDLELAGRRRDALALARKAGEGSEQQRAFVREVETRRLIGPRAELEIDGQRIELSFGETVTLGRADAGVIVTAPGVSRAHLVVRREALGPVVEDLGSRNGTSLAGARLAAPVAVGSGVELVLGGEARIALAAWGDGGVRLEVAGRVVHLPLGALSIGDWSVAPASDGWLELNAPAAAAPWLGELRADHRVELCVGDELRSERGGAVRLRALG